MIGVIVENGIIKEGTPLCVPSKEVGPFFVMAWFQTFKLDVEFKCNMHTALRLRAKLISVTML